jgi:hypothetical protein
VSEQYYDEHVAPKLLALAKDCEARGFSLVAVCEWSPHEGGTTATIAAGAGIGIRLTHAMAQAKGNVDSFMIAAARYARQHGHSSVVLSQMGVPTTPPPPADGGGT